MIAPRVTFLGFFLALCCGMAAAPAIALVVAPPVQAELLELHDVATAAGVVVVEEVAPALISEIVDQVLIAEVDDDHCHPDNRAPWVHRARSGFHHWDASLTRPASQSWQIAVARDGGLDDSERCSVQRRLPAMVPTMTLSRIDLSATGATVFPYGRGGDVMRFLKDDEIVAWIDASGILSAAR